jgi:hypothetical protein
VAPSQAARTELSRQVGPRLRWAPVPRCDWPAPRLRPGHRESAATAGDRAAASPSDP